MEYTFESAMERLEEISEILQENNVTLDQSLELYGEGVKLLKYCSDKLNRAQRKIISIDEALEDQGNEY